MYTPAQQVQMSIESEMNKFFSDLDLDLNVLQERGQLVFKNMQPLTTIDACWEMALACAEMWTPTPQGVNFEYNTPEYNAAEFVCICIKRAHENRR